MRHDVRDTTKDILIFFGLFLSTEKKLLFVSFQHFSASKTLEMIIIIFFGEMTTPNKPSCPDTENAVYGL